MIRVTVWNEFRHEKSSPKVAAIYPNGMHETIAEFLRKQPDFEVRTATLDEPEHGLTQEVLDNTDVLTWWGHMAHGEVSDEIVNRVYKRLMEGMGLIVLHSGHASKIFHKLMGTDTGKLRWREDGEMARLWVMDLAHPIAQGLEDHFDLPIEETYGEHFDIPKPDDLIFVTWYQDGHVFRGGCTFTRSAGKIFYFHPGHETGNSFFNPNVIRVIKNAIYWAKPIEKKNYRASECVEPLEEVR